MDLASGAPTSFMPATATVCSSQGVQLKTHEFNSVSTDISHASNPSRFYEIIEICKKMLLSTVKIVDTL